MFIGSHWKVSCGIGGVDSPLLPPLMSASSFFMANGPLAIFSFGGVGMKVGMHGLNVDIDGTSGILA